LNFFKMKLLTVAHMLRYGRAMKTQLLKGIALASLVTVMASPLYAQTPGTNNQPAAPTAVTQTQPAEPTAGEEAGYGVGAALASVFYIPVKVTYAGLGLLTGGLGYVLTGGRADVANNIIYPAVRGNYVVTPSHLKGTEPIYFVGAPPPEAGPRAEAPSSAPTTTR
jgi:hypothetical protein